MKNTALILMILFSGCTIKKSVMIPNDGVPKNSFTISPQFRTDTTDKIYMYVPPNKWYKLEPKQVNLLDK